MYEKVELERIKAEKERFSFEIESRRKDYRFRCIEIALQTGNCNVDDILKESEKLLKFIESKD